MSAYTSVPPAGSGDGEIPIFPGPRPARLCASRFLRRPSHDSSAVSNKQPQADEHEIRSQVQQAKPRLIHVRVTHPARMGVHDEKKRDRLSLHKSQAEVTPDSVYFFSSPTSSRGRAHP